MSIEASAKTVETNKNVELTEKRGKKMKKSFKGLQSIGLPVVALLLFFAVWQVGVQMLGIQPFILPKPTDIIASAVENYANLWNSVIRTITSAVIGFLLSVVVGITGAVILSSSRVVQDSLYPYAVLLQTVPIVAIAPIIVIWFGSGMNAIVIIAFIIGFFPMLSNTLVGLNSTDHNMTNLFQLYSANRWQMMFKLRFPAALPYIMAGLRISCTMAITGAIVGEYVAGIGGGEGGLGYSITVASARLQTAYLFALGLASSILGILFFALINGFSKWVLGSWHESEMKSEN
ncbi:MAG TPA: ABC transporter permease [Bacillota bacterium]|nr:ABC transporter permease [Bacillota bacterium]